MNILILRILIYILMVYSRLDCITKQQVTDNKKFLNFKIHISNNAI